MSYDRKTTRGIPAGFGFGGAVINLAAGDFAVGHEVKAIEVVAEGDIVLRPVDSETDITITGAPVGYQPPWHCSFIRQAGTTATLATVIG